MFVLGFSMGMGPLSVNQSLPRLVSLAGPLRLFFHLILAGQVGAG